MSVEWSLRSLNTDVISTTWAKALTSEDKMSRESFQDAYVEAALWSSTYGENGEGNMDDGKHELSDKAEALMKQEAGAFYDANLTLLDMANQKGRDDAHLGHDLWFSRNGYGTGFWDRGLGRVGTMLHDLAKAAGARDLYVGDDGEIYQM